MLDQIQTQPRFSRSTRRPLARFNSRHCSFLARQLQAVAPTDLTPDQREALALVLARGNEVDAVRKARQRLAHPELRIENGADQVVEAELESDQEPDDPGETEQADPYHPPRVDFFAIPPPRQS